MWFTLSYGNGKFVTIADETSTVCVGVIQKEEEKTFLDDLDNLVENFINNNIKNWYCWV